MKDYEIKGGKVFLEDGVQRRTGLPSPIEVADLDDLFVDISVKRQNLEAMRTADADDLTRAVPSGIPKEILLARAASRLLGNILLETHTTNI